MKDYKLLRIWEVIYPIGIYFVVTNVVMFVLNLMHTMTNENYMLSIGKKMAGKWQICHEPFYLQQPQAYLA